MGCNTSTASQVEAQRAEQPPVEEDLRPAPALPDVEGSAAEKLSKLATRLQQWSAGLARTFNAGDARKAIEDSKNIAEVLREDEELAASKEAQEVLIRICEVLTTVWQGCQEDIAVGCVTRICGGYGWALHGLCFELQDGRRLGRFLENNGSDMDLPNDAGLKERNGHWHALDKDEYIMRVSGHNCRNGYLCYSVTLFTNKRRAIEISAHHREWQGSSFDYRAKDGEEIINLRLNNGTCKGIETQPVQGKLPAHQCRQLLALLQGSDNEQMWESFVKVASQDGTGALPKFLFHLACNIKVHTLPCFQHFCQSISQIHSSPSFWDPSILESIQIEAGHRITTDNGKVLFSERQLSAEELALMQKLVTASFVRRYTRDRRGESVPDGLKLLSGYHIQNLNCWKDFATRNEEIKASLKAGEGAETYRVENLRTRGVLGEDERYALDGSANMEWLWHGTTTIAAKSIVRGDFRLDKAGSNAGTLFGKGLYFAESCSKSDEYCTEDEQGNRCLLLCRVTLGKVNYCDEARPSSAKLMSSCLGGGYHSILGDREKVHNTFREFIVYDDDQAYPEYVLFYQRVYN